MTEDEVFTEFLAKFDTPGEADGTVGNTAFSSASVLERVHSSIISSLGHLGGMGQLLLRCECLNRQGCLLRSDDEKRVEDLRSCITDRPSQY
jgi:hypothetical protein